MHIEPERGDATNGDCECLPCVQRIPKGRLVSRRAYDVPPLELLEAFEAAARHLSFTRAADELALTQSAVSRQIQALEQQLGAPCSAACTGRWY